MSGPLLSDGSCRFDRAPEKQIAQKGKTMASSNIRLRANIDPELLVAALDIVHRKVRLGFREPAGFQGVAR